MKGKRLLILCCCLLAMIPLSAQPLTITPEKPQRGQEVVIQYDPRAAGAKIPATVNEVNLVFTYSNLYELPSSIPLTKKGDIWQTSFVLPRYATYATFYIQSGDHIDQPAADKHYALPVYEANGKRVSDGYMYEGHSVRAQQGKVPDLAEKQAALFARELEEHPDNYAAKLQLLNYKMNKASGAAREKLRQQALDIIADNFYSHPGNMGYMNKTTMGYLIIGENSRLDSIRAVVKEKYPDTEAGYELRISDMVKQADTAEMVRQLTALLATENKENAAYLKDAHRTLMRYYARKQQPDKALYHYKKLGEDNSPYRPATMKDQAELFYRSGILLDTALRLSRSALALADKFPTGIIRYFPETGHIPSYVSPAKRKEVTQTAKGNLLSLIALIYHKQDKMQMAASNMEKALEASGDVETLANAGELYSDLGEYSKAFNAYRNIMKQTPEDTAAFSKMKAYYLKANRNMDGWEQEVKELKAYWTKTMTAELKKEELNIKAPEFLQAITDLEGNAVPADMLKNKIVIIDFWATWCVPCMHEMPYLQQVWEELKDDREVVFMVINSGSKNTLADAKGWWGNKKYSFPVYYNKDPRIGDWFGFNVIPATYVIDRQGVIRFKTIGYEGPVIARKLSTAVKMLKR